VVGDWGGVIVVVLGGDNDSCATCFNASYNSPSNLAIVPSFSATAKLAAPSPAATARWMLVKI